MSKYTVDGEYKGYFKLMLIMYGIMLVFAFINYLPQLGVTGSWIPIVVSIGPMILIGWYAFFVKYLVVNR